jgi:N-acetylmuramoyl-L-alanine amidase
VTTIHASNDQLISDIREFESVDAPHRIQHLIIHCSTRSTESVIETDRHDMHYVIPPEPIRQASVLRLVPDDHIALHATLGCWQGVNHLNASSIGIQLLDAAYTEDDQQRKFHTFSHRQIHTLILLCQSLIKRYHIKPTHVLSHTDVAPGIAHDPGPSFPWKQLAHNNIGAWFDETLLNETDYGKRKKLPPMRWIQQNLKNWGYEIKVTGKLDQQTESAVRAFQMHFRPSDYSGYPDFESCAILHNLVQNYYPEKAIPFHIQPLQQHTG